MPNMFNDRDKRLFLEKYLTELLEDDHFEIDHFNEESATNSVLVKYSTGEDGYYKEEVRITMLDFIMWLAKSSS
jgi:hypothetical protein